MALDLKLWKEHQLSYIVEVYIEHPITKKIKRILAQKLIKDMLSGMVIIMSKQNST